MPAFRTALASLAFACWASASALADPLLADFPYPYPVQTYQFRSQGQPLSMAYMDVQPAQPNGKTIVLLHGKNFCGATWEDTIRPLRDAGYRLIVPDQIGFCKSTKPQAYQFSLHQLAAQHARAARQHRRREADHHGPLHGRHAGHALRHQLPRRDVGPGAGQPDRPGRLEGQGRAVRADRPAVRARAEDLVRDASSSTSSRPTTPATGSPSTTAG